MRGIQLTKEQLEELYWKQGLSLDQIEEKIGCGRAKVYYWLKAFGIKRRAEYKKHIKIKKEILEELYLKQGLSLEKIGKLFNCHDSNIFYWMKKLEIKTRPVGYNEIVIPKEILEKLYLKQRLSSLEIGKKLGIDSRLICEKLNKAGIPIRSLSKALTKKFKAPFTGNLCEKAYLLGLRTGDFYAKMPKQSVRIQTTSTHTAQVNLLRNAVQDYGETKTYLSKNHAREDEWFIYADLDKSFEFLLEKPSEIPRWILSDKNCFYNFLCAYCDCEGTFNVVRSHENSVRFIVKIKTGDKKVLEQIENTLESYGYNPQFYLSTKKGTIRGFGKNNKDIYDLTIYRKKKVLRLIGNLLPFSKHSEKIRKIKFIQENKNRNWKEIEPGWRDIKKEIQSELLKNVLQN